MQKKQILLSEKVHTYYTNSSWSLKESPVLVFLHGWMQDGTSFEKIFQILEAKNISYVSLDLPGFGGSQLQHSSMNIDDYSSIVQEFIEKLSLKNPILVGHSFWGRVSIYLGSCYKNISKIVLICAAGVQKKVPFPKYILIKTGKVILSFPGLRSIWKKIREGFSSPDMKNAGKMETIFRNTIAQDLQEYMKQVSLPCLMIWGKDDDQTPVHDATIIHWHIKNSKLHILNGSHFVHQEKPEEITHLILDFLK